MLANGTVIDDKYQIEAPIGSGAFGAVYRAVQKQFDRHVAIKMLNTTLLLEADGLLRFEREAKSIDSLKHKNIVALYGYGAWQQAPYMVMEFVQGTSVDRMLQREKAFDPLRALRIIRQVFEGLGCAHKAGVVHRDLKPSNIMIAEDADGKECAKLIDFGLAKLMPSYGIPGQKLTETGYAVGTCSYMAPEQALGGGVDGRSDIYAAGCILYQMLTGRPPFDGDDNTAIMHQHLSAEPTPLSKLLAREFPVAAISALVANCMAKDAANRYQECKDAIADIDYILEGKFSKVTPLSARPMKSMHVQQTSMKHKVLASTMGAVLLAIIASGAYIWFSTKEQERQAQIEDGKTFVQTAIRDDRSDTSSSTVRQLERIKNLDDKEHFLRKSERFFTLVALGTAYVEGREHKEKLAEAYADEAAAMLPEAAADGYHHVCNVIVIYSKLGAAKKIADTLAVAETNPDMAVRFEARNNLVMHYLNYNRLDLCELYAKRITEENSKSIFVSNTVGRLNLAMVKFFQRDLPEANKYYQLVSAGKDDAQSWTGLARCALFEHDYQRAVEMTEQAQEAGRHSSGWYEPVLVLRAAALYYLGKDKQAHQLESLVSQDGSASAESYLLWNLDKKILSLAHKKQPLSLSDIQLIH